MVELNAEWDGVIGEDGGFSKDQEGDGHKINTQTLTNTHSLTYHTHD